MGKYLFDPKNEIDPEALAEYMRQENPVADPEALAKFREEHPDMAVVLPDGEGGHVLVDPAADGVQAAADAHNRRAAKKNCKITLDLNAERVRYFKERITVLGKSPKDAVILIANVDDWRGNILAQTMMPETDFQAVRDRGETPFLRGLVSRAEMQEFVSMVDSNTGEAMKGLEGLVVVVVDYGTAEVFLA